MGMPQNYGRMQQLAYDAARKFTDILVDEIHRSNLPGTGMLERLQFFSARRIRTDFERMYLSAINAVYFNAEKDTRHAMQAYRSNPRNHILLETAARSELDLATLERDKEIIRLLANTRGASVDEILSNAPKEQIAELAATSLKEQHIFIASSSYTPGGIIGAMLKSKIPEIKRVDHEATQKIHDFVLKKIGYR